MIRPGLQIMYFADYSCPKRGCLQSQEAREGPFLLLYRIGPCTP